MNQQRPGNDDELLVMTLDIGNGSSRDLSIYRNDNPSKIALNFARENGLDQQEAEDLTEAIRQNMERSLKELQDKEYTVFQCSKNWRLQPPQDSFRDKMETIRESNSGVQEHQFEGLNSYKPSFGNQKLRQLQSGSIWSSKKAAIYEKDLPDEQVEGQNSLMGQLVKRGVLPSDKPHSNQQSSSKRRLKTNKAKKRPKQGSSTIQRGGEYQFFQKINNSNKKKTTQGGQEAVEIPSHNGHAKIISSIYNSTSKNPYGLRTSYSQKNIKNQRPQSSQRPQRKRKGSLSRSERRNSGSSIHDRLYNEARQRKNRRDRNVMLDEEKKGDKLEEMKIGSNKKYSSSITKRLYYGGLKREEIKERYVKMQKYYTEMSAESELTFRPKIGDISKMIALSKENRFGRPIEDYLMGEGQKKEMRRSEAQTQKHIDEMEGVQSIPKINEISRYIASSQDIEPSQNRHSLLQDKNHRLYEESFHRMQKQIKKERSRSKQKVRPSFKPKINPVSEKIMKNGGRNKLSFLERQEKFLVDKMDRSRVESISESCNLEYQINPETDRPYFHPKTGRKPKNRNVLNLDIGNYLYEESFRSQLKKMKSQQFYHLSTIIQSNRPKINRRSSKIVDKKRDQRFEQIFRDLDSDNDGLISCNKVSIESLSENLLVLVSPVLIEMEELALELSMEEFSEALITLFDKLTVKERNAFLFDDSFKRDKGFDQELTFRPQINKNTDRLLQQVSYEVPGGSIKSKTTKKSEKKSKIFSSKKDQNYWAFSNKDNTLNPGRGQDPYHHPSSIYQSHSSTSNSQISVLTNKKQILIGLK